MAYPLQTFPNFNALMTYINNNWVTNGVGDITGVVGNNVVNGLLTFITQSPLNSSKATLVASTGVVTAPTPVVIFTGATPTSFTWNDNIYNEYIFCNTTLAAIPLASGKFYRDINLTAITQIPAKSVVCICQAANNQWFQTNSSTGSIPTPPPLIGIAGNGGGDDPIVGLTTYQNDKLIGLGSSNGGRITISINTSNMINYGISSSFTFDPVTGTISRLNEWQPLDTISADLNQ